MLGRGYAIVTGESGAALRSVRETRAGERVAVTLEDGQLRCAVTEIEEGSIHGPEKKLEENMARLEEIVQLLEKGDAKLADSLKLFEEGTKLVALCSGMLEEAEGKVVKLRKGSGGAPEETDFLDAPPEGPSGGM